MIHWVMAKSGPPTMKIIISLLTLALATSGFAANGITASSAPPRAPEFVKAGPIPSKSFFGGYSILNRSMASGQTSIQPEQIFSYGAPTLELYEGQWYWSIRVTYATPTNLTKYVQGFYISEARALVRYRSVMHWLYEAPRPTRSSVPVR